MPLIRKIGKYLWFYLSDPRNFFAKEEIAVTKDGIKFLCLRENQIERSILDTGLWEPLETQAVKNIIQDKFVVYDVGANIGYFTLLMSRLVGANGQVHSFEPTKYGFSRLKNNLELNRAVLYPNIILNKKGLSSCVEQKTENFESRFSSRILAHQEKESIEFCHTG
jgi:hypothetical protein